MHTGKLGHTGIDICRIGLGSAGMTRDDCASARLLINAAAEMGVNLLDIRDANPALRSAVGRAIVGRREDFVIMGHLGVVWDGEKSRRTRFMSEVMEGFEDLLERLGTGYVDVGVISALAGAEDFEKAISGSPMNHIIEEKDAGRVICAGADCADVETALLAEKCGIFDVIILEITPAAAFGARLEELCLRCEKSGVALLARVTAIGGFGVNQSLSYALDRPGVCAALTEPETPDELALCGAWAISSPKSRDFSAPLLKIRPEARGECLYCGRCAPCPKGIDIPAVLRLTRVYESSPDAADICKEAYAKLKNNAARCVFCGACERRCPAAVDIRAKMRRARTDLRA